MPWKEELSWHALLRLPIGEFLQRGDAAAGSRLAPAGPSAALSP